MQTIIFYAIVEIIAIALFALANKWREKRKEITGKLEAVGFDGILLDLKER